MARHHSAKTRDWIPTKHRVRESRVHADSKNDGPQKGVHEKAGQNHARNQLTATKAHSGCGSAETAERQGNRQTGASEIGDHHEHDASVASADVRPQ